MLPGVILFFDPAVSGLGSKLIYFRMTPKEGRTPMRHVLKLRVLDGDGNDLLLFCQLKDAFQ